MVDEAVSCLTHSFVNGGRCANNEPALKSFSLDADGNPNDIIEDDMGLFLSQYEYNDYDLILNIADLMASYDSIQPPIERLKDIASRRTIDPKNRPYFLAEFTNALLLFMKKANWFNNQLKFVKVAEKDNNDAKYIYLTEGIEEYFNLVANCFYSEYQYFIQKEKEKKNK